MSVAAPILLPFYQNATHFSTPAMSVLPQEPLKFRQTPKRVPAAMVTEHHWDPDEGPRPPSPPPSTEAAAASEGDASDAALDPHADAVAPFSEAQLRPLGVVLRDLHQTVKCACSL
jgi:hypothetical protein